MDTSEMDQGVPEGLTRFQIFEKRTFDFVLATVGLILTWWIMILAWLMATIDTGENGLFSQTRIGRWGRPFTIYKIRTMRTVVGGTSVTTRSDPRITPLGKVFRKAKIDELPQLVNVLLGSMSFVGPRPDVPGFADRLEGEDKIVLSVRPGITGPATLRFRNEEELLAAQEDPDAYNHEVLFPEKVRINREYIENYSLWGDIRYIVQTVLG